MAIKGEGPASVSSQPFHSPLAEAFEGVLASRSDGGRADSLAAVPGYSWAVNPQPGHTPLAG